MKKILLILFIFFISATTSFAAFYIDGMGAYVDTNDLEAQTGVGAGMGFGLTDRMNLSLRATQTSTTKKKYFLYNHTLNYEYTAALIGFEYIPEIPVLENNQFTWNFSVYGGVAKGSYDYINTSVPIVGGYSVYSLSQMKDTKNDTGVACAFWTGPHFYMTQNLSFYIEAGYHYTSFSNDLKSDLVHGIEAVFGVRCYLFGVRDYTDGYN